MMILHKPTEMVAGEEYTIQCEVTGSRPKATVTWTRDSRIFRRGKVRSRVILLGLMDRGSLRVVEKTNKTNGMPSVFLTSVPVIPLKYTFSWAVPLPPQISFRTSKLTKILPTILLLVLPVR